MSSPASPPRLAAREPTPPISGPSVLGLNQPNVELLRERAFSGLDSYSDRDEPQSRGSRVFLMLLLLAALGGGFWWTYTNYLSVAENHKPQAPQATNPAAGTASTPPETASPKENPKDITTVEPAAPENPPEKVNATPQPKSPGATSQVEAKPATEPEAQGPAKPETPAPTAARHEVRAERVPAPKTAPAADSGDALFRRGESYLYGRGGTEDCASALKYLKMASDKQHAKARSAMGTMYATGHCVPRDLPSSYRWFALALRVDPNNTILERNLSAVWNQMTPPERQLATKSQ
ncbi:MAG: hypothetical protein WAQ52_10305 [Terriglobales bacterium]